MKRLAYLTLFFILLSAHGGSLSAREVYSLNNDWRFFFRSESSSDAARRVTLPHTWNLDALTGTHNYRQTTADYLRELYIPREWKNKRLFLRFYGVQNVADVFINGEHAGEHRGGFTAFTFEITDKVRYNYDNTLHVMVSNNAENDIFPLSSEMNLYGGIYRDVELIVTDRTAVAPDYYGTDAVVVSQLSATKQRVEAAVTLALTTTEAIQSCNVKVSVTDPDGYAAVMKNIKLKPDGKSANIPFTIENPELWSPSNPKMYRVEVVAATDTVAVYTGFRSVEVTPGEHFMLNGKTIPIRGVTLPHDRMSAGSAWTESDYEEDLDLIRDLGANALRSPAAPHAPALYDACDRSGILVWIDFPLTQAPYPADVAYISSPRLLENGRQQIREIIVQNCNHPSVVMWGLFSNLRPRGAAMLDYLREINAMTKKLDASRPTVACSNHDGEINFITDLIVWQQNCGWENGRMDDLDIWQSMLARDWSNLRQAIAYGPDSASWNIYDTSSRGKTVAAPYEVRLTRFHQGYADRLQNSSLFWGLWLNGMFDFGSSRAMNGIQDCGLASIDRKRFKDIFYLYRALWNDSSPTLHIKGKQYRTRTRTRQTVGIFSSEGAPTLTINGDTVAVHREGECLYVSDTVELRGRSDIEVRAGELTDRTSLTIGNVLKHR